MIDFTSRQLRAFLLVAQHRSFSRAAGALFITPSGLSVLIRELETQLGARLFDRTTRHVALTASGTELLAAAQRNLQELDSIMSRIGRSGNDAGQSFPVDCLIRIEDAGTEMVDDSLPGGFSRRLDVMRGQCRGGERPEVLLPAEAVSDGRCDDAEALQRQAENP